MDEFIYVADTYNLKIKKIDIANNSIETLAITNIENQLLQFNEPAGLCFDATGQFLLISDTNNHQLQMVDIKTLQCHQFELKFPQSNDEVDSRTLQAGLQVFKRLPLSKYKALKLNVSLSLDNNLKFTAEAPQKWSINASNSSLQAQLQSGKLADNRLQLNFERIDSAVPLSEKDEHIRLDLALSLCNENSCLMKRFVLMLQNGEDNKDAVNTDSKSVEQNVHIHISENEIKVN